MDRKHDAWARERKVKSVIEMLTLYFDSRLLMSARSTDLCQPCFGT